MPSCTSDFYFPDWFFVVLESKAWGGQHLCSTDKPRLPRISLQLSETFTRDFGVPWITAPEECCVAPASNFYHFCFLTPPASWSQSPTVRPKPSTNSVPGFCFLGARIFAICKCCLLRTTMYSIEKQQLFIVVPNKTQQCFHPQSIRIALQHSCLNTPQGHSDRCWTHWAAVELVLTSAYAALQAGSNDSEFNCIFWKNQFNTTTPQMPATCIF